MAKKKEIKKNYNAKNVNDYDDDDDIDGIEYSLPDYFHQICDILPQEEYDPKKPTENYFMFYDLNIFSSFKNNLEKLLKEGSTDEAIWALFKNTFYYHFNLSHNLAYSYNEVTPFDFNMKEYSKEGPIKYTAEYLRNEERFYQKDYSIYLSFIYFTNIYMDIFNVLIKNLDTYCLSHPIVENEEYPNKAVLCHLLLLEGAYVIKNYANPNLYNLIKLVSPITTALATMILLTILHIDEYDDFYFNKDGWEYKSFKDSITAAIILANHHKYGINVSDIFLKLQEYHIFTPDEVLELSLITGIRKGTILKEFPELVE